MGPSGRPQPQIPFFHLGNCVGQEAFIDQLETANKHCLEKGLFLAPAIRLRVNRRILQGTLLHLKMGPIPEGFLQENGMIDEIVSHCWLHGRTRTVSAPL